MQDVIVDAADEDLPMEWVKKRRSDGSIYYFNVLTNFKQDRSPNDLDGEDPSLPRLSAASHLFPVRGRDPF